MVILVHHQGSGDHFGRNSRFSQKISTFLLEFNLLQSWEKFEIDFTHFQETNNITHVSKIDHFFWSPCLEAAVINAGVIHHNDNMSDHAPIYCSIDYHSSDKHPNLDSVGPPSAPKPSWKRATVEQKKAFPTILNEKLSSISISETLQNCSNVKCRVPEHCNETDEFISNILECVESAATEALPVPPPPNSSIKAQISSRMEIRSQTLP